MFDFTRLMEFFSPVPWVQFLFAMVLFCVVTYIWEEHKKWNTLHPDILKQLPPGSSGFPFIGETLQFLSRKQEFLRDKLQQHGEVYRTNLFGNPTIRISGAENVSKIFQGEGQIVQSSWPPSVKKLITDNGVLLSTGSIHKLRKRAFSRSLSLEYLASSVPVIGDVVEKTLTMWKSKGSVEIFPQLRRLTTELFLRCNIDSDMSDVEVEKFSEVILRVQDNLFCLPINIPGFSFYKAQSARKELKVILQKHLKQQCLGDDDTPKILRSTVQTALEEEEFTNEDSVLDSVFELIFAGNDTVSGGLFSVVYLLHEHYDEVEKVRDELRREMIYEDKTPLSHNVLQRLTYTGKVVKEVLRLMTPVGGVYRKALQSFKMRDYIIPEGWTVIASIRDTHEQDTTWTDVLEFRPERWRDDPKHEAFFTFGAGDRMCPGRFFAQLVLKIFVVELARNVNYKFLKPVSLEFFPTPRPKEIAHVHVSDRYND